MIQIDPLWFDLEVCPHVLLVMLALRSYNGNNIWASNRSIARKAKISLDTLDACLDFLIRFKMIEIRKDPDSGQRQYVIRFFNVSDVNADIEKQGFIGAQVKMITEETEYTCGRSR